MERFNPLNDYLFFKLMGEKGDEAQCLSFLNAVLADSRQNPIRLVRILENRIITPEIIGNKTSILDFHAQDENGAIYEVEVQSKDLHNMEKRTLQYWAREYAGAISSGDDYRELPRVITINIVNFDSIKLDRFHTSFHIREDLEPDYILTDVLEVHFLNMVKFRKAKHRDMKNDALCQWLAYFDITTPEKDLEELIKMNEGIQKADEKYGFVTRDKNFLRDYHRRQMEASDWTTGINTAMEKGLAQGLEKGLAQGRNEITIAHVKNALAKGYSVDAIQDITGLSAEEITALREGAEDLP